MENFSSSQDQSPHTHPQAQDLFLHVESYPTMQDCIYLIFVNRLILW